jgi:two-component system nitrate/nitrite response regulator NarL
MSTHPFPSGYGKPQDASPLNVNAAGRSAIRVLIVDDHPVVRIGVRNMLSVHGRFAVVSEAIDGEEAILQTARLLPAILLMDVQMPRLPGIEALRSLTISNPRVKIVLLTGSITAQQVVEAIQIGARGVIYKDTLTDQLTSALLAVAGGHYWIGGRRLDTLDDVLKTLEPPAAEKQRFRLTRREMEVVQLIARGYSNRELAKELSLSEETVKRHLSNTFDKTGVSTRLELALFAMAHNLVASD